MCVSCSKKLIIYYQKIIYMTKIDLIFRRPSEGRPNTFAQTVDNMCVACAWKKLMRYRNEKLTSFPLTSLLLKLSHAHKSQQPISGRYGSESVVTPKIA